MHCPAYVPALCPSYARSVRLCSAWANEGNIYARREDRGVAAQARRETERVRLAVLALPTRPHRGGPKEPNRPRRPRNQPALSATNGRQRRRTHTFGLLDFKDMAI